MDTVIHVMPEKAPGVPDWTICNWAVRRRLKVAATLTSGPSARHKAIHESFAGSALLDYHAKWRS